MRLHGPTVVVSATLRGVRGDWGEDRGRLGGLFWRRSDGSGNTVCTLSWMSAVPSAR